MKIMYFLAHPYSIGGATKVLIVQAFLSKQSGNEVKLVIQNDEHNYHTHGLDLLCEQYGLEYTSERYTIATCLEEVDIKMAYECYERVYKLVEEFNPDLLHSIQLNTVVEMVSRKLHIPHLMNVYPVLKETFNIPWEDIWPQFHSCDSLYYSQVWAQGLNVESKCIRVAYPTPKMKTKCKHNIHKLICVASFFEYKQQMRIIEFVQYLKEKGNDITISFVGYDDTLYGNLCKSYVRENGLEQNVEFIGEVISVEPYLQEADLMIHVSKCESYPGVLVEAMANGVPVMIKAVAGIPELIKDGENGYLIYDDSIEGLYSVFLRVLDDWKEDGLETVISKEYETFLVNHTFSTVQSSLEDYYKRIYTCERNKDEFLYNIYDKICDDVKKHSLFTQSRVWYLYNLKKQILKNKICKCMIWGAGSNAVIAKEWCDYLELKCCGFIDVKKRGAIMGYRIYAPEDKIIEQGGFIIVSVYDLEARKNIMRELERTGHVRNVNYILMFNDPCLTL